MNKVSGDIGGIELGLGQVLVWVSGISEVWEDIGCRWFQKVPRVLGDIGEHVGPVHSRGFSLGLGQARR